MAETRRQFDQQFRDGAARIVRETGKPIVQVAKDLGVNPGTLGNWVKRDRITSGPGATGKGAAPCGNLASGLPVQ